MLIKVSSVAPFGLNTVGIDVEVNISSRGFPGFEIVGLPNKSVAESRERVKNAILNSGFEFPNKKIIVNLAPADIQKDGSSYDLPIAVGILTYVLNLDLPDKHIYYGELSLDGKVRHTKGTLVAAIHAKNIKYEGVFCSLESANEASAVSGISIFGLSDLGSLVRHVMKVDVLTPNKFIKIKSVQKNLWDFKDISGQNAAKRALEIAAAGGHNVLLIGPPGVGKSLLAKSFPSILPEMNLEEALEVTKIYSISGLVPPHGGLLFDRPFRSPHHSVSYAGILGGGTIPGPGEISLAHRGVLFLDEFSEFSRYVIESLRQPLEDGVVTISRSGGNMTFPCRFILVAAANPCPCGYLNSDNPRCKCSELNILRYQRRISGPVLDRIDMVVKLDNIPLEKIKRTDKSDASSSSEIKKSVEKARQIQFDRFKNKGIFVNKEMGNKEIAEYCKLDSSAEALLDTAAKKFNLSPRSYFKILKVSRTIADLSGASTITSAHIAECLEYVK